MPAPNRKYLIHWLKTKLKYLLVLYNAAKELIDMSNENITCSTKRRINAYVTKRKKMAADLRTHASCSSILNQHLKLKF